MDGLERKPIIADKFTKPWVLFWVSVLPQAILIFLNLRAWLLIKGEMTSAQTLMSAQIFGFEIAIIIAGIISIIVFQSLKREIGLIVCSIFLIVHIAYLWLFIAWLDKLLPNEVTIWILTPDEILYYQFIFMMPMVFYTALRLACFYIPVKKSVDISISVATLITVPFISYLFITLASSLLWSWDKYIGFEIFMIICFIGATTITMMAFLRVLAFVYTWLINIKSGYMVFLFVVGLIGPLAGLALNKNFPFPYDFQSIAVYVLAIINGIILLLSIRENSKVGVFTWVLRCLMYPFSLYFFLVFLPFLPLSLIAILAMGGGFLIMVPTALFVVHTQKLIDEGKRVITIINFKTAILLFIISFSVMPLFIVYRAYSDRYSLMKAVDTVYNPDYSKIAVDIKPESVKRSLLKLKEMKDGIFLPFISTFYNKVVFNGMVLPDYKMEEMYKMFTGGKMPESQQNSRRMFAVRSNFRGARVTMPERNVEIFDIKVDRKVEGDFVRANIELTLINMGEANSEFVGDIELKEGIMISDYWLKIGDTKVSGSLFEKKAAMWIYHMIRDVTRRDPGLLIYKNDNLLKLSVYPLAADEKRSTGLELLYPVGMNPVVSINNRIIKLMPDGINLQQDILFTRHSDQSVTVIVPEDLLKRLPSVERKPYLHFIIDHSANSDKNKLSSLIGRAAKIAKNYAKANQCQITLANIASFDMSEDLIDINNIEKTIYDINSSPLNFEGGFCCERIIQQKLLAYNDKQLKDVNTALSVPLFIAIKDSNTMDISSDKIQAFEKFVPDAASYYISNDSNGLTINGFNGKETTGEQISTLNPVVILKSGSSVAVCCQNDGLAIVDFANGDDTLEFYDPSSKTFKNIADIKILDSNLDYAKGLYLWHKYRDTIYRPYIIDKELPEIIKSSKQCGIMTPLTSYIVLENSAQMEMLKRKEKQSLDSNNALEFDEFMESPAPSIVFLLPFVFALLLKVRQRKAC